MPKFIYRSYGISFILITCIIAGCSYKKESPRPRYIRTETIIPGLFINVFCVNESGAGIFDTGTDYDYYLVDSVKQTKYIGNCKNDDFFDFRFYKNVLHIKKISEISRLNYQSEIISNFIITDSINYDLAKLGFNTPKIKPLTPCQKDSALKDISKNMVLIKGGTFEMGSDWSFNEMPIHKVSLDDFYMSKYEVSQELWETIMGYNPSCFANGDNFPVENIDWYEIQNFIHRLNRITSKEYCLPTEAQWEYAARGGCHSKNFKYSGNNLIGQVAWYSSNSNSKTHKVGQKQPNELGLFDMSGNVNEWCNDWYDHSYETKKLISKNPMGNKNGMYKTIRGGAWDLNIHNARPSNRERCDPRWGHSNDLGFRLVEKCK